ncbi:response regulator transcription factor [Amycolatopsis sp. NBC_01480]|uniref:response regulator transcription factor n=1 Tax=Amycolatopsis sp. NBC_01480 TaxID=2903562 RepID=UPI002E2B3636|nr:helix-turn-helix transcriptional regulator [Amycolatopsis sp. NBC_01480]
MKKPRALTPRELEILVEVARGMSNPEIAVKMFVSIETVRTHLHHISKKLGARNRAHAVAIAYHTGIFQPGHKPRGLPTGYREASPRGGKRRSG